MSKLFKAVVNNNYDFDFTPEQINELDIVTGSDSSIHVLHESKSFQAKIIEGNFIDKLYKVEVNGNNYHVKLHNSLDVFINKLGLNTGLSKKENYIKAPMPGLIVSVDVSVGQESGWPEICE